MALEKESLALQHEWAAAIAASLEPSNIGPTGAEIGSLTERMEGEDAGTTQLASDVESDYQLAQALQEDEIDHERASLERWHPRASLARRLGSMGRALSGGIVKLVPRINSGVLPCEEAISADRARLEQRIRLYGMQEVPVKGDGNCQFRALAEQLYGSQRAHATVRQLLCRQLRLFGGWYREFVVPLPGSSGDAGGRCDAGGGIWGDNPLVAPPLGGSSSRQGNNGGGDGAHGGGAAEQGGNVHRGGGARAPPPEDEDYYGRYVEAMARDGEWGDHVTLQAAADAYHRPIMVLTSYEHAAFTEIAPRGPPRRDHPVLLSFWAEVHYNALKCAPGWALPPAAAV